MFLEFTLGAGNPQLFNDSFIIENETGFDVMSRVIEISETAHRIWKLMLEKGGSFNVAAMAALIEKKRLDPNTKQELLDLGLIRMPKTNQFIAVSIGSDTSLKIQAPIKPAKKAKRKGGSKPPSSLIQSTISPQTREDLPSAVPVNTFSMANLEKRVTALEGTIKELSSLVNFLRDQWTKILPSTTNAALSSGEVRTRLKETLQNLQAGWQPIDTIWNRLPLQLQKWDIFQEIVEELSDERSLSVNKGESQHQIIIRGESYGSIRRIL